MLNDPKYPTVEDVIKRLTDGLAALHWRPHLLLICTCSGKAGPAWYRAEHHAAQQIERLLPQALGSLPAQTFIDSYYRKPSHGMLAAASWAFHNQANSTLIYIGDMDTDRQAASAAKCRYLDAAEWRAGAALA